jgi:Zn-dependent peptidase ImmA (M78 family)
VLVATSGVVGNDSSRRLDPREFRGFCLSDRLAPLIFVNGADLKAAQTFTLCHELAHLTLGHSGVSAEDPAIFHDERIEAWCDDFATELVVPKASIAKDEKSQDPTAEAIKISRELKASPLVALRQVVAARGLGSSGIAHQFSQLREQLSVRRRSTGGNFYATALARVGKSFARSVIASTLEGHTTFVEAFRLLGIKKGSSFDVLATRLGFQP